MPSQIVPSEEVRLAEAAAYSAAMAAAAAAGAAAVASGCSNSGRCQQQEDLTNSTLERRVVIAAGGMRQKDSKKGFDNAIHCKLSGTCVQRGTTEKYRTYGHCICGSLLQTGARGRSAHDTF
jgi:hypothetical protein